MEKIQIIIESVSTREWAILFWFAIFMIWALRIKSIRESFGQLIKMFFNKKILLILTTMTLYVLILFFVLNLLGLIRIDLAKDYLYWYFGFAFVSLFSINIFKDGEDQFKRIIKELIKVTILIEFIVSFYTFSFGVELIFVPVITFVFMMEAFSKTKSEYESVRKLFSFIVCIIGLLLIYFVSKNLIAHYESLFTVNNFLSLLTPILLSLLFLPFLYLVTLYMTYENLFIRFDILLKRNPEFIKPLKRKVLVTNNLNLRKLRAFIENSRMKLTKVSTQNDIDNLFDE